jgi:hypothetical protein
MYIYTRLILGVFLYIRAVFLYPVYISYEILRGPTGLCTLAEASDSSVFDLFMP